MSPAAIEAQHAEQVARLSMERWLDIAAKREAEDPHNTAAIDSAMRCAAEYEAIADDAHRRWLKATR